MLIQFKCEECGSPIYKGEQAYRIGGYGSCKYICTDCCEQVEVDIPEPDEDYIYDNWREQE